MSIVNKKNNVKSDYKYLKSISNANKKALVFMISSIIAGIGIIILLFYYFFYSDLKSSKKNDRELYFAILFIDDNNIPYGAYVGVVSSLHNRIGIIGLPKNLALRRYKEKVNIPLYKLYETGGKRAVFKAIEVSIEKKITYKITVDNNQISDIVDLIGGVRMYIEEPINEENFSFDIGEWIFYGNKVVSYLHYLTMRGYEEIETLYRLEDVIINAMIGIIQNPELKNIMMSKDMRGKIASRMKSNLRPPDIKILFDMLANSSERTLIVESADANMNERGLLTPIFEGKALIKQLDDLTLYVGLKTQKSELETEDVSLIVLNGTGIGGLADRISIRMRYRGFKAGEYGNFRINNLNESVVLIRNGQIEKSFIVAKECRINRVYAKTDRRLLNNAVLILGKDYYEITR
mgnify:FL=1